MNDEKFAESLTKKDDCMEIVKVDTDLPGNLVVNDDVMDVLKRLGMTTMSSEYVRDLARYGIHVKSVGAMHTQRGALLINQSRLATAADILMGLLIAGAKSEKKKKIEEVSQIARSLGYITGKLNDVARTMIEMDGGFTRGSTKFIQSQQAPTVTPSFKPGQTIVPANSTMVVAQEVHMHQAAPDKESQPK